MSFQSNLGQTTTLSDIMDYIIDSIITENTLTGEKSFKFKVCEKEFMQSTAYKNVKDFI